MAADRARRRARLRAERVTAPAAGRRRRPAAGQRAARRRHLPDGHGQYEKRAIAKEIPIWDPDICIDCGKCAIVCPARHHPHEGLRRPTRSTVRPPASVARTSGPRTSPGHRLTIQVAPDDCTGCGVCVDVCPAKSKTEVRHKAINMEPALEHRDVERARWDFFSSIPPLDRSLLPHDSVKGSQVLEPLFEFSGACAGCGETPYLKLVTQLFGDRMIVANATGCSSIYGGNLPTTPWTANAEGRGPGVDQLAVRGQRRVRPRHAPRRSRRRTPSARPRWPPGPHVVGADLASRPSSTPRRTPRRSVADATAARLGALTAAVERDRRSSRRAIADPDAARHLLALADTSCARACGSSAATAGPTTSASAASTTCCPSGRNVNILVLDTEVYSNTGGQASKATPRGAVAKFAASGKATGKKDLGAIARAYGNVYVAQISMGANDLQTTKALLEADAWPGPSLVIAYSTCIAHGIDMSKSMTHQKDAVRCGYWPLYRFQPSEVERRPAVQARLQSAVDPRAPTSWPPRPASPSSPARTPSGPSQLAALAQADVDERWRYYAAARRLRAHDPRALCPTPVEPDGRVRRRLPLRRRRSTR